MKFNVASKSLQQQLSSVSKVINSKNAMSILDNFLFRTEGNTLYITGSDSENVITASMEIYEPEGDGSVAVPAKKLMEILKEVSGQALTFYINDESHEVDIRFLNGHFNFMGVNAAEFPTRPVQADDALTFTVPANVITSGLENTLFAVSPDTLRPTMTGVYWDIFEDNITFVASDTHKLVKYVNRVTAPGFRNSFILPPKPAGILRNIVSKETEEVKITTDAAGATFEFDNIQLSCRFIKGNYPDYNRVFPQENPFELTVDRVSLLNAMRRVALFASAATNLIRMSIEPNEILLSSQDLDYATSADERIECDYKGNSMLIGFSSMYIIEVLNNLHSDTVVIRLSDPARPGIFQPLLQEDGSEVVMLLMPMQVLDY